MDDYANEIKGELAGYACEYLLTGKIVDDNVSRSFFPEGIEETHPELTSLLEIHYLIHEDVIDFIEKLPERIRRIRTETKIRDLPSKSFVKGRINWGQTLKERQSNHLRDHSFFVCSNPHINYNLPENILLKNILCIIYKIILRYEETILDDSYGWVRETWGRGNVDSEDKILSLKEIIEKNVYIQRINSEIEVTERTINTAENSRNSLYQDAAKLYRVYNDTVISKDPNATHKLLSKTMIIPEDSDQIYQVYVFFKTLKALEGIVDRSLRLNTIKRERKASAEFINEDGENLLEVYYDTTRGSDYEFKPLDSALWEKSQETMNWHYGSDIISPYTGRPDIIIKKSSEPSKSIIIEIKYTQKLDYVKSGVQECLEYIQRCQDTEKGTIFSDFGSGLNGAVIIKKHPLKLQNGLSGLDERPKIKIFDYEDLKDSGYKKFLKKGLDI